MYIAYLSPLLVALIAMITVFFLHSRKTRKKETEIRKLKEKLQTGLKEVCEKASAGDLEAQSTLKAIEEISTEQSIRLTGRPKPPTTVIKPV